MRGELDEDGPQEGPREEALSAGAHPTLHWIENTSDTTHTQSHILYIYICACIFCNVPDVIKLFNYLYLEVGGEPDPVRLPEPLDEHLVGQEAQHLCR